MRLGVVFPQTEIGSDPAVIRDYAQAAEQAGYDHLLVFDHVLDLGATHLSVNTMGAGLSPRGHIDGILKMKPALDGA